MNFSLDLDQITKDAIAAAKESAKKNADMTAGYLAAREGLHEFRADHATSSQSCDACPKRRSGGIAMIDLGSGVAPPLTVEDDSSEETAIVMQWNQQKKEYFPFRILTSRDEAVAYLQMKTGRRHEVKWERDFDITRADYFIETHPLMTATAALAEDLRIEKEAALSKLTRRERFILGFEKEPSK